MQPAPLDPAAAGAAALTRAIEVLDRAYAPYSGFAVGCAVETADGALFAAANLENASYGVTVCAEVGALAAANAAAGLTQVRRVALVGRPADGGLVPITPCGRCRQVIHEAACVSGVDIEILTTDAARRVSRYLISELLPNAFGPEILNR
jgi:cytidine deaminase